MTHSAAWRRCLTADEPDNRLLYVCFDEGRSFLFGSAADPFAFDATDVWPLLHSYAFDFSVWEIWGALAFGGRLVMVPACVARW